MRLSSCISSQSRRWLLGGVVLWLLSSVVGVWYLVVRDGDSIAPGKDNPLANLQAVIEQDIRQIFAVYLKEFLPLQNTGDAWLYQIKPQVNLSLDHKNDVVVDELSVDIKLHPTAEMTELESRASDFLSSKLKHGKLANWIGFDQSRIKINIRVAVKDRQFFDAKMIWAVVLAINSLLALLTMREVYNYIKPGKNWGKKKWTYKKQFNKSSLGIKVADSNDGTYHIDRLSEMAATEIQSKIMHLPLTQIYGLLRHIPIQHRRAILDKLEVSPSIKKYLVHKI